MLLLPTKGICYPTSLDGTLLSSFESPLDEVYSEASHIPILGSLDDTIYDKKI